IKYYLKVLEICYTSRTVDMPASGSKKSLKSQTGDSKQSPQGQGNCNCIIGSNRSYNTNFLKEVGYSKNRLHLDLDSTEELIVRAKYYLANHDTKCACYQGSLMQCLVRNKVKKSGSGILSEYETEGSRKNSSSISLSLQRSKSFHSDNDVSNLKLNAKNNVNGGAKSNNGNLEAFVADLDDVFEF
ncbi:MAG: hypothetical protein MHPSP_000810, partial [Paramarteilia canceri]